MKNFHLIIFACLFSANIYFAVAQNFEQNQKKYSRVQTAFSEKEEAVKRLFNNAQISFPPKRIFIRIYKYERSLELWAVPARSDTFKLIRTYPFCSSSGRLGPKRRQGDYQIPEGFYWIDRFNPRSHFYLSLGLNYPNRSDQILGAQGHLGGDIFIHGDCVTIGCIPITDDKIKELYLVAVKAKSNGQHKIPVHIFPFNLADKKVKSRIFQNESYLKYRSFWKDLEEGHRFFEATHTLPEIEVDGKGRYIIK